MVISCTGTTVADFTAHQRIRKIIASDRAIEADVNAAISKLESKNLNVLQEIDADPNLTEAEKDAEKELKKRELAILSVYINNLVFQQKVLAAL